MTTITPHSDYATLINVFTVEPDRAQELAELLTAATEEVMQHLEGFRAANIHLSADRTRIVNYAQWDSAEAYEQVFSVPHARAHIERAAAIATSFDPHLYTVESVHAPRER